MRQRGLDHLKAAGVAVTLAASACEPAAEIPFEAYEADGYSLVAYQETEEDSAIEVASTVMLVVDDTPVIVHSSLTARQDGEASYFAVGTHPGARQPDGTWLVMQGSLRCKVESASVTCVGADGFDRRYDAGGTATGTHTTRVHRFDQ